jgi:hypothetical protein
MSHYEQATLDDLWGEMTLRRCEQCGERPVWSDHFLTRYCAQCRDAKKLADNRASYRRADKPDRSCRDCGAPLSVKSKRLCDACLQISISRQNRDGNLRKYGLNSDSYEALLESQGRRCVGCRMHVDEHLHRFGKSFSVDHHHICCPDKSSCGTCVRGLLCNNCNAGYALLGEDVGVMARLDRMRRISELRIVAKRLAA